MIKSYLPGLKKRRLATSRPFSLSIRRHTKTSVYRTVAFLVYNKQDIEDIVNEVYMRMWRSIHKYDPNRPFRFWLHGITVRLVQDWKRKAWRRLRIFERNRQMICEQFDWTDIAN